MDGSPETYLQDRPALSRRHRRVLRLLLPPLVAALCTVPILMDALGGLERLGLDWRFRQRGQRIPDRRIVIVQISETGRRQLSQGDVQFYLRDHLHEAITRLADAGAVAIGFDFWLQGRGDPQVDGRLAKAIAGTNVVLGVAIANDVAMRSPSVFLEAHPDEGSLAVQPDPDGVLRRIPVTPNLDLLDGAGKSTVRIPHMPFVLSYLLLSEEAARANRPAPVLDLPATGQARLGDRIVRYGGLINFAAEAAAGFKTLDLADVVRGTCDLSVVDGSVVLIGTARSLEDQFVMPLAPRMVPGVYYHANVVDMILNNRPLREWPEHSRGVAAIAAVLACLAGWYSLSFRQWWLHRAGWLLLLGYSLSGLILFVGGWVMMCTRLFDRDLVLPLVPPLFAVLVVMLAAMATQFVLTVVNARRLAQRSRQIESLFGRSVSLPVLAAIKADPVRVSRTELRDVSVLFCDIRGFTATSTNMPPNAVAAMLNEYFEAITSAVFDLDGFVDKFVGDELMAVFSAPLEQADQAERAAAAALAIKRQLAALNAKRLARGQPAIDCGIGIHCGPAAAGHIGTDRRANYTVVGDTVNLAARIEELTTHGEILISDAVVRQLNGRFPTELWGTVQLRGSPGGHTLYRLPLDQST